MRAADLVIAVILAIVAAAVILPGLSEAGFSDEDEALYAQIAREMIRSGDYLTPRYLGEPFYHKPPLEYWLMAAAHALAGPGELAARLPSALAGVLMVIAVFLTARRLSGIGAGILAAGMLLFGQQFLFEHGVRSAVLDAELTLACFVLLIAGAFARGRAERLALGALALGAVLMLKAPIAAFPLAALGLHRLLRGQPNSRDLLWVVGGGLLLALPWHLYQLLGAGREFVDVYFGYEMFGRLGSTAGAATPGRFVHLQALLHNFEAWTPVLLAGWVAALAGRWPRRAASDGADSDDASGRGALLLFAVYAGLFLVILCFVRAKWPWYVLPAHPALAVLGGCWLADALRARGRWIAWAGLALAGGAAALRWALLEADPAYLPATRASVPWPEHEGMLSLGTAESPWAWSIAVVALLAVAGAATLAWRRPATGATAAGIAAAAACALILGRQALDVAAVPRGFEHPVAGLSRALADRGYGEIHLVGFRLPERYDRRLEPIPAYYLSGLSGARLHAGERSWQAAGQSAPKAAEGVAIVVKWPAGRGGQLRERLGGTPGADVWAYAPGTVRGFWPLASGAASSERRTAASSLCTRSLRKPVTLARWRPGTSRRASASASR